MKILHICNGYDSSALYSELFYRISEMGITQEICAPARYTDVARSLQQRNIGKTSRPLVIRNFWERLFFLSKVKRTTRAIVENHDINSFNITHAHSLFSDGAVALNLLRKFQIPYIVAVRNVDVNIFLKYALHLRKMGLEILQNACKVIFISSSYIEKLYSFFPKLSKDKNHSIETIYNGVDDFWLKNRFTRFNLPKKEVRLLFVGDFCGNKNLLSVFKATEILRRRGFNLCIRAVGMGGRNDKSSYIKRVQISAFAKNYIFLLPRMPKEQLALEMRDADLFILPSKHETFGLVYAEALSQGLPIIYSKGQGFDGIFPDGSVGFAVDPVNLNDIANAIEKSIASYATLTSNIKNLPIETLFNWYEIAQKYVKAYKAIAN